jgi:hypothetical protein
LEGTQKGDATSPERGLLLQELDSEATTALYHAVSEIRESLFLLADHSIRLTGCPNSHDALQRASDALGIAERELSAVSIAPVLVAAV